MITAKLTFRQLDVTLPPGTMARLATRALSMILQRTRAGMDFEGAPFAPYSPLYARNRQLAGYGGDVRLQVTGKMLTALRVRMSSDSERRARLGFEGAGRAYWFAAIRTKAGKLTTRAVGDNRKIAGASNQKFKTKLAMQLRYSDSREVAHAEKAAGLQTGTKPRVFMRLSRAEMQELGRMLAVAVAADIRTGR